MDPGLRELLNELADAGTRAEFSATDDACPVCRALSGRVFEPRQAPTIPVPGCENDFCRCDYLPVVDYDELRRGFSN